MPDVIIGFLLDWTVRLLPRMWRYLTDKFADRPIHGLSGQVCEVSGDYYAQKYPHDIRTFEKGDVFPTVQYYLSGTERVTWNYMPPGKIPPRGA